MIGLEFLDPYKLRNLPKIEIPQRSIPAKGAQIGYRWINGGGIAHKRWEHGWVPGLVEQLTAKELIVLGAANGQTRIALWLDDPWEWRYGKDIRFWLPCAKCQRLGEHHYGKGEPCKPCAGTGIFQRLICKDCKGHGVSPGTSTIVSCLDCGGWGAKTYNPWPRKKRARQQRRNSRNAQS